MAIRSVAFAQNDYRLSLRWTIPMLTPIRKASVLSQLFR